MPCSALSSTPISVNALVGWPARHVRGRYQRGRVAAGGSGLEIYLANSSSSCRGAICDVKLCQPLSAMTLLSLMAAPSAELSWEMAGDLFLQVE